jgi:hypothetical protein
MGSGPVSNMKEQVIAASGPNTQFVIFSSTAPGQDLESFTTAILSKSRRNGDS